MTYITPYIFQFFWSHLQQIAINREKPKPLFTNKLFPPQLSNQIFCMLLGFDIIYLVINILTSNPVTVFFVSHINCHNIEVWNDMRVSFSNMLYEQLNCKKDTICYWVVLSATGTLFRYETIEMRYSFHFHFHPKTNMLWMCPFQKHSNPNFNYCTFVLFRECMQHCIFSVSTFLHLA